MRVRILYHDHCFDGAAAAAYFSRFLEERFHPDAEFLFTGLAHKADQIFEDWMFDGEVNAIVDFKYSPDPRLTWWFDHHQSAFLTPEDAERYRLNPSEKKLYDPEAPSCTGFIARVARERWGWEAPDLVELVRWADIIDGAQYPDARTAVEMPAAAMKLTLVIEGVKGSDVVQQIIRWMRRRPLDDIISEPEIQQLFAPLYERHLRSIEIIRERARCVNGVVSFDLIGYDLEGYNKFIPYYLFPEAVYSVSVSTSSFRTKVSVGSNPWAPRPPRHNLATICERYGGGGHARVGAISFPLGEYEQARKAAREIVEELGREAQ
ncbi:MAG: phosphoesterase [Bryobacteraceae bacterium]